MFTKSGTDKTWENRENHRGGGGAYRSNNTFNVQSNSRGNKTTGHRPVAYPYGLDMEDNSYQQEQLAYHAKMQASNNTEEEASSPFQRLSKIIASSGYCARRKAERLILDKRISVDGTIIDNVSYKIDTNNPSTLRERILLDGQPFLEDLEPEVKLWIIHKPKGCLVTKKANEERPTIFELLPPEMSKVVSIGRLDFNTSGLLLLTNSGRLANYLSNPTSSIKRVYRVKVFGNLNPAKFQEIQRGITIRGEHYIASNVTIEEDNAPNSWLKVTMTEGKNREVRKLMQYCGLQVTKLIRTSFGEFSIDGLEPGQWKEIDTTAVAKLTQQMQQATSHAANRKPMRKNFNYS